ncbi:MAG: hypothetical protein PWR24_967 [Desulfonauticus sp.]|nr:hypothetical protein [Desulfonauticus sp.]
MTKVLIPILGKEVAPRFDLALEVFIVEFDSKWKVISSKNVILPESSGEEMCSLILKENVDIVLTNGIEDEYYNYLKWKKVKVIDNVMDNIENALAFLIREERRYE